MAGVNFYVHHLNNLNKGNLIIMTVGLHPTVLQSLQLPSHETEERTQSQRQRHQQFIGQGILQVRGKCPGVTPQRVRPMAGRTQQQSLQGGGGHRVKGS